MPSSGSIFLLGYGGITQCSRTILCGDVKRQSSQGSVTSGDEWLLGFGIRSSAESVLFVS